MCCLSRVKRQETVAIFFFNHFPTAGREQSPCGAKAITDELISLNANAYKKKKKKAQQHPSKHFLLSMALVRPHELCGWSEASPRRVTAIHAIRFSFQRAPSFHPKETPALINIQIPSRRGLRSTDILRGGCEENLAGRLRKSGLSSASSAWYCIAWVTARDLRRGATPMQPAGIRKCFCVEFSSARHGLQFFTENGGMLDSFRSFYRQNWSRSAFAWHPIHFF